MSGRFFSAFIVVFWAAMMAALMRVEMFSESPVLESLPAERVLHKVLSNPEPARLDILYNGQSIGRCSVDVEQFNLEGNDQAGATAYRVRSEWWINVTPFGAPTRLHLRGESLFNARYEMESYRIRMTASDTDVLVEGNQRTRKAKMVLMLGDMREERVFDFAQVRGGGLASALGLPGVGMLGSFGAGLSGGGIVEEGARPTTRVVSDRINVGGTTLRTYLVESRYGDSLWAKLWIGELGEVLRVTTSFGLTMESDVLRAGADGNVEYRE